MKQYPGCCQSRNCGEIYCKGCPNEKHLIAYYGAAQHEGNQLKAAFTLAREVNNALEKGDYQFDVYYNHLAGRFLHFYACGHREVAGDKDITYSHQCADCQSMRPAH